MLNLDIIPNSGRLTKTTDPALLLSHITLIINELDWNIDEFVEKTNWVEDKGIVFEDLLKFLEFKGLTVIRPPSDSIMTFMPYDVLLFNDILFIITYKGYDNVSGTFISLVKSFDIGENRIKLVIDYPSIEAPGGHIHFSLFRNPVFYAVSKKNLEFISEYIKFTKNE